jgi:hypothetical protein
VCSSDLFLVLVALGLLMLAALGADALAKKRSAPLPLLVTLGGVVTVSGLLALLPWLAPDWCADLTGAAGAKIPLATLVRAGDFAMIAWVFLALAFAWIWALAKTSVKTAPLMLTGVLLVFVNLWIVSRQLHPAAAADDTLTVTAPAALDRVARDRDYRAFSIYSGVQQYLYADPRPEIYRWAGHAGSGGMWAGLGIRQQYSAMLKLQKYHQLTGLIYSDNATASNQALDLYGVKWLVTGAPWQSVLWGNAGHELKIIERPTAVPRFKLFAAHTPADSERAVWEHFSNGRFFKNAPLVEPACLLGGKPTTRPLPLTVANTDAAGTDTNNIPGTLTVSESKNNRVILRANVTVSGGALLFFGDTWYPGWSAFVDGQETPVHRASLMFMGIPVPSGEHTITFEFYPVNFGKHSAIAALALLIIGGLFIRRRK